MPRPYAVLPALVLRTEVLHENLVRCEVSIEGVPGTSFALNYPGLVGPVKPGDQVSLNATAVELGLGSGGFHFVMDGPCTTGPLSQAPGHIMKLRYTPWQIRTLAVEEPDSPHHDILADSDSLDGAPVVCIEVHSQLLPVVAGIRSLNPDLRVAYVMTDGGALPAPLSAVVNSLREAGWVDPCITAGNSFGGDWEAVNVHSALIAGRWAFDADVMVAGMGPGIVGTATPLGHTGLQQAEVANAAVSLEGRAVLPLRISLADPRPRHRGISHHTMMVATRAALGKLTAVMPAELAGHWPLWRQLVGAGVHRRHSLVTVEGSPGMDMLRDDEGWQRWRKLLRHMGRGISEDREYFLAAAAAGRCAALLSGRGKGDDRDAP